MNNRLELQRRLCIFVQKLKRREKSGWKHLDLVCSCCSLCFVFVLFFFHSKLIELIVRIFSPQDFAEYVEYINIYYCLTVGIVIIDLLYDFCVVVGTGNNVDITHLKSVRVHFAPGSNGRSFPLEYS